MYCSLRTTIEASLLALLVVVPYKFYLRVIQV